MSVSDLWRRTWRYLTTALVAFLIGYVVSTFGGTWKPTGDGRTIFNDRTGRMKLTGTGEYLEDYHERVREDLQREANRQRDTGVRPRPGAMTVEEFYNEGTPREAWIKMPPPEPKQEAQHTGFIASIGAAINNARPFADYAVVAAASLGAFVAGCYRPKHGWWVFWVFAILVGALAQLVFGGVAAILWVLVSYGLVGMTAEMLIGNKRAAV
jgi:hypothetical protein